MLENMVHFCTLALWKLPAVKHLFTPDKTDFTHLLDPNDLIPSHKYNEDINEWVNHPVFIEFNWFLKL